MKKLTDKLKKERGITLIALIITIIILLILAGIVITLTIGENGLFNITKQATQNYTNEYYKELNLVNDINNIIENNIQNDRREDEKVNIEVGSNHIAKELVYNWEEFETLARIISNNYGINEGQINNRTEEVTITIDEEIYTLGIGDWITVNYNGTNKKVMILGFNHDKLSDNKAYNDGKAHTYAGISFQIRESLESNIMNSTRTNVGGWGDSFARERLNSICLKNIENKSYIKEVRKTYLATHNDPESLLKSNDKLWILSCAEVYGSKFIGTTGNKQLIEEGEQYSIYIYYEMNKTSVGGYWWLRTPGVGDETGFLHYGSYSSVAARGANGSGKGGLSYLPGFCI